MKESTNWSTPWAAKHPQRSFRRIPKCISMNMWIRDQIADHFEEGGHLHSRDHTENLRVIMSEARKNISAQTCNDAMRDDMKALLISLIFLTIPADATPLPMVCELISEEAPHIKVRLTERTAVSLRGELLQNGIHLGTFQTGQSRGYGPPVWWSFHDSHDAGKGISVLFYDNQHWNPHRRTPRPSDTNRVLFVGFDTDLLNWNNAEQPGVFQGNRDLIKAAAGFWTISNQCLGGRIMRGWAKDLANRPIIRIALQRRSLTDDTTWFWHSNKKKLNHNLANSAANWIKNQTIWIFSDALSTFSPIRLAANLPKF